MHPTLLIAESDAVLRDVYRKFLADRGYEVETASNGLECLEMLIEGDPDVLVLDIELLWGGGDGILAWLREEQDRPAMAVVLTPTVGYLTDASEVLEGPVVQVLPKPFALTALLESVRSAVVKKGRKQPCC